MQNYTKRGITIVLLAALVAACGTEDAKKTETTVDAGGGSQDATTGLDGSGTDVATADGTSTGTDAGTSDGGAAADTTATDAGPAPKYGTCTEVADCVATACADNKPDCEKPCLGDASATALQAAVPLLSCYQSKCIAGACKDSKDPKCNSECITQQCIGDFLKCIDTPATGTALCSSAFDCFDACDLSKGSGFACYTKCIDALSPDDTKLLAAMGVCMAANPGQDPEKVCTKDMYACVIGSKSGDKGCHTVFQCSADCQKAGGTDDSCMGPCIGALTKKDQGAFLALAPCLGKDDMNSDPKCVAALKTCIDPSGKESCPDTFDCASKCPDDKDNDDPSCMFTCLHDTTPDGYDTFLEMSACGNDDKAAPTPGGVTPTNPPGNVTPTDNGPSEQCIKSMVKCADPSGKGDCATLFKCFGTCQDKQKDGDDNPMTCIFACSDTGSSQAYADLITFSTCNDKCDKECAGKGDSCTGPCMQKGCPAAMKACFPPS